MDKSEIIMILIIAIPIVLVLAIGGYAAINAYNGIKSVSNEITVVTIQLRSIDYQNNVQGRFALGCGNVNETEYYVCYQEIDDGGLSLTKFEAEKTIIYETLTSNNAYAEVSINGFGEIKKVKLYVPEDTVQMEYDLGID